MNLFDFFNFSSPAHNGIAENGADAKPCLSDVYKHTTRAKRRQADTALCGRSMVEMLGVLAIIGVLSVGAISGYSKAMLKYKLNKQTEQFNTIINAVIRYKDDLKLNDGSVDSYNLVPLLKKLHEVPEDMYVDKGDNLIKDVFGVRYHIYHHVSGYIGILTTSTNMRIGMEICQNLYSIAKEYHASVSSVLVSSQAQTGNNSDYVYGDKECKNGAFCLRNMTISDMVDRCHVCEESEHCNFYYMFL